MYALIVGATALGFFLWQPLLLIALLLTMLSLRVMLWSLRHPGETPSWYPEPADQGTEGRAKR